MNKWVNETILKQLMSTGFYEDESEAIGEIENAYQNLQYDTDQSGRTQPGMTDIARNMKDANIEMDYVTEFLQGYYDYCDEHPYCDEEDDEDEDEESEDKLYSVYVGGGEVNDEYLTKEEAEKLYDLYVSEGYEDVEIVEKE